MNADLNRPIWYAAFGSNVHRDRLLVYLTGGTIPFSPSGRVQEGARDASEPTGDQPFLIERTLLFAGRAKQWGDAGVAFCDSDHNPITPTHGRAYRLTAGQVEDVFRQENGQSELIPLDFDLLSATAPRLDRPELRLGSVQRLGEIGGEPVVTITSPSRPPALNAAHVSYLTVIGHGLMTSWDFSAQEAAFYLASRPGNAGIVDPVELTTTLAG